MKQKRPRLKLWVTLFCAATLGLGAGATWLFSPSTQDRVSQAEAQQRAESFSRIPPLQLKSIAAAEQDARIASMQLPPASQAELKKLLKAPQMAKVALNDLTVLAPSVSLKTETTSIRLVELTLWDSHAADGDVVRVTSAGYSRDVTLQKQPVLLAIPVQGSTPIQITGVHDGGGGITLAAQGTGQPVMTPIMSEGQSIALPIAP